MIANNFPWFKNAFQKATFSPALFGRIERIIVNAYIHGSVGIGRTKRVMDLVMLSTRDGKLVYTTNVGREAKVLRRSIVKICILNVRMDVFGMFSVPAAAQAESKISNWLDDSSISEISDEQVEVGCLRHKVKSERATTRRISKISKGSIYPTKQELVQLVVHCIYGYVMDMFVFCRKNARTFILEDV